MKTSNFADVAVIIVGFRNPEDVRECLESLSSTTQEPTFDILICENGGVRSFEKLVAELVSPNGPCIHASANSCRLLGDKSERLQEVQPLKLKTRCSNVWVGCAVENIGYAAGINVWIDRLLHIPEWKGIWVLNPDSQPDPAALSELFQYAACNNQKGIIGSTIIKMADRTRVHCRAGHHWRKFQGTAAIIGFREAADLPVNQHDIEVKFSIPFLEHRCT